MEMRPAGKPAEQPFSEQPEGTQYLLCPHLKQCIQCPEYYGPRAHGGIEQQSGDTVTPVAFGDHREDANSGQHGNYQDYNCFHLTIRILLSAASFSKPDRSGADFHQLIIVDE